MRGYRASERFDHPLLDDSRRHAVDYCRRAAERGMKLPDDVVVSFRVVLIWETERYRNWLVFFGRNFSKGYFEKRRCGAA